MNIYNFENQIADIILSRGYDYYQNGLIVDIHRQGENEYIFTVEGSDDYEVVVKINESGEIVHSYCDCPFDYGPVCKHEAAVYYQLSAMMDRENKEYGVASQHEALKQPHLEEILNHLSKEELVRIVRDIAQKDAILRNKLLIEYSKGEDGSQTLTQFQKIIEAIVRKYTRFEGFISYRDVGRFANEMNEFIEKIMNTDNVILALDMSFLLLEELIEAFQYADDSDGDIGMMVDETLEVITDIVNRTQDLDEKVRKRAFNKLLEMSDNPCFEGWDDYWFSILYICTSFADDESFRNTLKLKVEEWLGQVKEGHNYSYQTEGLLGMMLLLIQKDGEAEAAERFMKANLHYSSIREQYIRKFMQQGNYHRVIELALEGEAADQSYPGLVSKWKELRYTAYKELSLKEEQKKLAKVLLLNGDFEYYHELQQLSEDHEACYRELKEELQQSEDWRRRGVYLRMIETENDLTAIMEYVRDNPHRIESYASRLAEQFKDEVIEIYLNHIRTKASEATKRKDYQAVCGIVSRYKKIAGSDLQKELIKELQTQYMRRPAFIDELNVLRNNG